MPYNPHPLIINGWKPLLKNPGYVPGWDGIGTILMGVSIITDLVYTKWQYVILLHKAMNAIFKRIER